MRVIAGRLGGRRLVAPRGDATRPTADRVREALFSSLGDVSGAVVADLYAGTGALGIEALSRGASRAVFVENARPALAALSDNLASLGLGAAARVLALPLVRALPGLAESGPFDLVLADPPYADVEAAAALLEQLAGLGALAPGARIVLEHARRAGAPALASETLVATKSYGDTSVSVYRHPGG